MAGYAIHLAVAEEYIRNYPDDVDDYEKFIEGVIYPDNIKDKSITHYGIKSSKVNLKAFFEERDIEDSFNKGYFLHLVTDYLFYNKFLDFFSKDIYNDYDILNKLIIEKFKVTIPEKVKDQVFYKNGNTKLLDLEETINFIKNTANYKLSDIKKAVLNNDEYWLTLKQLQHK